MLSGTLNAVKSRQFRNWEADSITPFINKKRATSSRFGAHHTSSAPATTTEEKSHMKGDGRRHFSGPAESITEWSQRVLLRDLNVEVDSRSATRQRVGSTAHRPTPDPHGQSAHCRAMDPRSVPNGCGDLPGGVRLRSGPDADGGSDEGSRYRDIQFNNGAFRDTTGVLAAPDLIVLQECPFPYCSIPMRFVPSLNASTSSSVLSKRSTCRGPVWSSIAMTRSLFRWRVSMPLSVRVPISRYIDAARP